MALNAEIDALLNAADAQEVTIEQVLQQVLLRSQSEQIPDDLVAIGFSDFMGDGNWPTLIAYMQDYTSTVPVDVAYARTWSTFVTRDQTDFMLAMMQLLRCFARDFQYNVGYPSYASKSQMLMGTAALTVE